MKHLRDILFLSAVLLMLPLGSMRAENADEMLDYECVDTIAINSTHLQTTVKAVVIVPSQYFDAEMQEVQFPVLYLLHGFGDNYAKWTITDPELADMATEYGTIIVCPDGLKIATSSQGCRNRKRISRNIFWLRWWIPHLVVIIVTNGNKLFNG